MSKGHILFILNIPWAYYDSIAKLCHWCTSIFHISQLCNFRIMLKKKWKHVQYIILFHIILYFLASQYGAIQIGPTPRSVEGLKLLRCWFRKLGVRRFRNTFRAWTDEMTWARQIRIKIIEKGRPQEKFLMTWKRTNRKWQIKSGRSIPEPWKSNKIKMPVIIGLCLLLDEFVVWCRPGRRWTKRNVFERNVVENNYCSAYVRTAKQRTHFIYLLLTYTAPRAYYDSIAKLCRSVGTLSFYISHYYETFS